MRKSDFVVLGSLQLQVVLILCIKHERVKSNHETVCIRPHTLSSCVPTASGAHGHSLKIWVDF